MSATVYRMYDESGDLLYVGCTTQLPTRLAAHSFDKPWWTDVVRIAVEHFASREDALKAEAAAIRDELPSHNVLGLEGNLAERRRRRVQREAETTKRYLATTFDTGGRWECASCGEQPERLPKGTNPINARCKACGCTAHVRREVAA